MNLKAKHVLRSRDEIAWICAAIQSRRRKPQRFPRIELHGGCRTHQSAKQSRNGAAMGFSEATLLELVEREMINGRRGSAFNHRDSICEATAKRDYPSNHCPLFCVI